jgi:hypothetical protein
MRGIYGGETGSSARAGREQMRRRGFATPHTLALQTQHIGQKRERTSIGVDGFKSGFQLG